MSTTNAADSIQKVQQSLAEAERLIRAGQNEAAERLCRELLSVHPRLPGALNMLALLLAGRGAVAEAEEMFNRAIAVIPEEPGLYNNLANLQKAKGDLEGAERSLRKALALKPDFAEGYYNLGLVLVSRNEPERALAAYRRALAIKPDYPEALVQAGVMLKVLGRHDDALASYDAAVKAQPAYFDGHYYRGDQLATMGRFDEAVAAFDAALRLRPDHPPALFARANTLARARRDEDALEAFRYTVERVPQSASAHREYNALAYTLGKLDPQNTSYAQARAKIGDHPDLLLGDGEQHLRLGNAELAEQLLSDALRIAPERIDIANARGRALIKLKRFEEAIEQLHNTAKRDGRTMDSRRDLATALLMSRRSAEAIPVLEQSLAFAPFDQLLLAFLALAYREQGDDRYAALVDHEKYVRIYDFAPPSGFADAASFNQALGEELGRLHTRTVQPLDQSLRGGTQTVGDLFAETSPSIAALRAQIEDAVRDYSAALPDDPSNPVAVRKTNRFGFSGSWSCRLHEGGYHDNHVHHQGWISSAYYVALPDVVTDESKKQGWLKFGESNIALGERDRPARIVQPAVGRLVLFPSYFWHGTLPFASDDARMTVAFDVVPSKGTNGPASFDF
ncbi:MAG TPA: tetratricopeptide repeat protein [Rhizomicrobium sp.]|nr:tetratricopeptide repeat protein [Rhizomicrobium sp.]